jgi:hypothetical protein
VLTGNGRNGPVHHSYAWTSFTTAAGNQLPLLPDMCSTAPVVNFSTLVPHNLTGAVGHCRGGFD